MWNRSWFGSPSRKVGFHWAQQPQRKLCIFEMIYFARPDSVIILRVQLHGCGWGGNWPRGSQADVVIGVPDSGCSSCVGFSQASGIPYAEGLIKIVMWVAHSSSPPRQCRSGIRMKLNPLKDVAGKRIVIVDDSIVRYDQPQTSKPSATLGRLRFMRVSSPPVTHPASMA